ncbi:MAG: hypothetical protein AAF717_08670 [Bacteroidota bacterium]
MINAIRSNSFLFIPLLLSLLFFLRKGIQYAILGSYIPLLVIALFVVLMSITIRANATLFLYLSRIWAGVLIVWSLIRIGIAVVNYATTTFDEYHLSNQFGMSGILISALMLAIGITMIRNARTRRIKAW